ncbi:MAG: thiolase family protein, partial [Thaumarchaeota archaeon]|nr:thiolase family protein [Nitrososphaerota archaeon]
MKHEAAICSYALTPTSRAKRDRLEETLSSEEYLGRVFEDLMEKSGLEMKEVDGQGLAVSGMVTPHSDIWTSEVAQLLGVRPKWLIASDHGGASGLNMVAQSILAVETGVVDLVVCLGVDAPLSASDYSLVSTGCIRDYENPSGIMGPNSMFAFIMRRHMEQYGTTVEQIGKIAVEQRKNALRNPLAYMKKELTIDDYLSSKLISDPIKLLDCCLPVNQGLGLVIANSKLSKRITDKPVYLVGFEERDAYYHGDIMTPDITYTGIADASRAIFQGEKKMSIRDMDFAQMYDDYCIAVIMQLEDLGFCEKGKGGEFVERHSLASDGDLPVNTGGGQLSSGQPGLAGGFVPVVEAVMQLRREAGNRQVRNAKKGC